MIQTGPLKVNELVAQKARDLYKTSGDLETVIRFLRNEEENRLDSMKLLIVVAGVTLGEAKEIIHFRPTWKDDRTTHESFLRSAFQAAEVLQKKDGENLLKAG